MRNLQTKGSEHEAALEGLDKFMSWPIDVPESSNYKSALLRALPHQTDGGPKA
jgi:hypothetical protein